MLNDVHFQITRVAAHVAVAAFLFAGLAACEEDVTAVTGTDLPFSLYGVISPQLDSQWVRVYPVEGRLTPAEAAPLDAVVTSTDLVTGEEWVWTDSIIVDFANQNAHVFWAPFKAEYSHRYRIESRHPDGRQTFVEVAVPEESEILVGEYVVQSTGVFLPIRVPGDIPRLLNVEVEYAVNYRPIGAPDDVAGSIAVPYFTQPREEDDGWLVPVNLREDYNAVVAAIVDSLDESIDTRVGVNLLGMTVRVMVATEEWNPPNNQFDVELLIQPGVMTNVDNGFGFVGAGYRLEHSFLPPGEAVALSGFRPLEGS